MIIVLKTILFFIAFSLSLPGVAAQSIPVYWPFSISSVQVVAVRSILDSINIEQVDKNFLVVHKPGAGSAVAAMHVAVTENLELLAVSSSFFMRPAFFPEQSHRYQDLRPIAMMATDMPALIMSKKYKTVDELRNQKRVTIGVIHGSITQLMALNLQKNLPGIELVFVPYQGTNQPTVHVLQGALDLNVGFADDVDQYVKSGMLNILGVSGKKSVRGYPTFSSLGMSGFDDITVDYWVMASAKLPDSDAKNLHQLFSKHLQAGGNFWQRDEARVASLDFEQTNQRYKKQSTYWKELLTQLPR